MKGPLRRNRLLLRLLHLLSERRGWHRSTIPRRRRSLRSRLRCLRVIRRSRRLLGLDREGHIQVQQQNGGDGLKTENSRIGSAKIHAGLSKGLRGTIVHFAPVAAVCKASSRDIHPSRSSTIRLL